MTWSFSFLDAICIVNHRIQYSTARTAVGADTKNLSLFFPFPPLVTDLEGAEFFSLTSSSILLPKMETAPDEKFLDTPLVAEASLIAEVKYNQQKYYWCQS